MTAQVDFSGFHYRTDRVHEFINDLLEGLRERHPEIETMDVQIKRSLFGTYTTRMVGKLFEDGLEAFEQSTDPVECFEQCLNRFRRRVEEVKSRLAFQ